MKIVIIVESPWVIAKYMHLSANLLGLEPIFLYRDNKHYKLPEVIRSNYPCHKADITSADQMFEILKINLIVDIVAVTTFEDCNMQSAIRLAQQLDVSGPDVTLLTLTDKSAVIGLVPEYSPMSMQFNVEKIPYHNIQEIIGNEKSFILKPDHGSGSIGMTKIKSSNDLGRIDIHVRQHTNISSWILQEEIIGELFSIEGYYLNRELHLIGYSIRDRINNIDMSNHFPMDHNISSTIKDKSSHILNELIIRSGFQNGYFHCEFLSDGYSVYLIDANLGRIGGGPISEQLAISFGHKPEEVIAHIISVGVFHKELDGIILYHSVSQSTLGINYGIERDKGFQDLSIKEIIHSCNTIVINSDIASILSSKSNYLWIGVITGLSDDVLRDIKNIIIKTNNGDPVTPSYYVRDESQHTILKDTSADDQHIDHENLPSLDIVGGILESCTSETDLV